MCELVHFKVHNVALIAAFLMFFIQGCDDTSPTGNGPLSVEEIKVQLLENSSPDNLITAVDTTTTGLIFRFEDGKDVSANREYFSIISSDPGSWTIAVEFSLDRGNLVFPYLGENFEISLIEKENQEMFPLVQDLQVSTPFPGYLSYLVKGRNGKSGDIRSKDIAIDTLSYHTVIGLYPEHANTVIVNYHSSAGSLRSSRTMSMPRDSIESMPEVEIIEPEIQEPYSEARLFLTAHRMNNKPIIIDQEGEVRWYANLVAQVGLQQSQNGNLLFTNQEQIFEVAIKGEIKRTYRVPAPYIDIHHDIHERKNGDLLLTVDNQELNSKEDVIVLMDRDLGQVIKVWDLNESIPRNYELIRDTIDWLHVNAVDMDERDRGLLISGQRRGVFKVSWDNQLVWIASDPKGFNYPHTEFLLETDQDDIFWGQHDIQIDEENDVYFVFDNGLGRNYSNSETYSRGVKFTVDQNSMKLSVLKSYGRDHPEYFSPIISGIHYSNDGKVLINFGSIGYQFNYQDNTDIRGGSIKKDNPAYGAVWLEYNRLGQVTLHMRFSGFEEPRFDKGIYRARYIDIFK
jgi:arylsulfate sulfotransferase|tara:strand:+ start:125 stop:1834 length:1710 start_codon:yes stop_codon:yes gene_type:complete